MTAQIESAYLMGQTLTFVRTETGEILYQQKRHLLPDTYIRFLINALKRARFSSAEVTDILNEINTFQQNYYWNKRFYKPVSEVVRHFLDVMS